MPEEVVDDAAEGGLPLEAPAAPSLHDLRHSAAHLMAAAVVDLFPGAQYDVGPPTEDGFFYNFRLPGGEHVSDKDLAAIEERMHALAKQRVPFIASVMDRAAA